MIIMENSKVKTIIEGVISIIDENSQIISDETIEKHFMKAVNAFHDGSIDFSTFVSKCLAQGLITGKHWKQEMYDLTAGLQLIDLEKMQIVFPW